MIKKRQSKHVRKYLDSSKVRLKRKKRRTLLFVFISASIVALLFGGVSFVRADKFQYKEILISGNKQIDQDKIKKIVIDKIAQDVHVFGLVPYTSIFFISDIQIENELLNQIPRIKSIKVDSHINGLIDIKVVERGSFAKWCNEEMCYDLDVNGYIFGESFELDPSEQKSSNSVFIKSKTRPVSVSNSDSASNAEIYKTFSSSSTQIVSTEDSKPLVIIEDRQSKKIENEALAVNDISTTTIYSNVSNEKNNHVSAMISENSKGIYVFKGLISGDPVGKTYLEEKSLTEIANFISFLKSKNKKILYIKCDSVQYCDVILTTGAKIIIDVSEDLKNVIERFEVALENKVLANDMYEYVDLRYGNKIFFKIIGGKEMISTSTKKSIILE